MCLYESPSLSSSPSHTHAQADVASGKLLVVMHADPWAVMLSSTQRSAWKSLLQSLGGKYAALANAGDKAGKNLMQPHPLHDILM